MKKIMILGATLGAVKIAEEIRRVDAEVDITLMTSDGFYPSRCAQFARYLAKEIKKDEILVKPKKFYDEQKINVVLGANFSRINPKRGKISTEDKKQFDFDYLVFSALSNSLSK